MKTSLGRRDYHRYVWAKTEIICAVLRAAAVVFFLAYFFYRSLLAVVPLSVVGVFYLKMIGRSKQRECRKELVCQFKECILSVAASLKAGYALENAFLESRSDMQLLYGEKSLIYQELELIRRGLVINITLEDLLNDLAKRSDSEEIKQFAGILSIAKRSGGNIAEIIQSSTDLIGQRIETAQEINTILSGRQMEQKIMRVMPFGILIYIGISSPGYFDPLYHNWQGVVLMTVCLAVYLGAYVLGEKIMQHIEKELAG